MAVPIHIIFFYLFLFCFFIDFTMIRSCTLSMRLKIFFCSLRRRDFHLEHLSLPLQPINVNALRSQADIPIEADSRCVRLNFVSHVYFFLLLLRYLGNATHGTSFIADDKSVIVSSLKFYQAHTNTYIRFGRGKCVAVAP